MQEEDSSTCSSDDEDIMQNELLNNLESNLSSSALAALNEFLIEKTLDENDAGEKKDDFVKEDFHKRQFWYDEETATTLAKEVLHATKPGGRIAIMSAPRAMPAMLELAPEGTEVFVLEIDERFKDLYGERFVEYDMFAAEKIPAEFHHSFDAFLIDPPFHTHETMVMYADAIKMLAKSDSETEPTVFACTGSILRESIFDVFGLKPTSHPIGFQNKFCNPSYLYASTALCNGSYI
jgi:hypothetical protein